MGQWFSGVDSRGYENHSWTFVSAGSWFSCYKYRLLSSPFILAVFCFQPIFRMENALSHWWFLAVAIEGIKMSILGILDKNHGLRFNGVKRC